MQKIILIYTDLILPANDKKVVCQALGLNCFDTKKCLPATETSILSGLDITLAALRKSSFDSLVELAQKKVAGKTTIYHQQESNNQRQRHLTIIL